MKILSTFSFGVLLFLLLQACSKDPVSQLSAEESRIYITRHDSSASFNSFVSFSIADSAAVISNNQLQGRTRNAYDSLLIQQLGQSLQRRGYKQVSNTQNPDLGINVNYIINSYTGLIDYGNYYGSYGGYWDPYYWGYPGYGYYGSFIGVYQVNEGLISIDLFDLKHAASDQKIKSIWNAVIRGPGIFKEASISTSIQAIFDQSPYLKAN